jgi:hypothetical protein
MEAFLDPQILQEKKREQQLDVGGGRLGSPKTTFKKARLLPTLIYILTYDAIFHCVMAVIKLTEHL